MADKSSAPVLRSAEKNNLEKIEAINLQFKEREVKDKAKKAGIKYIDLKNTPVNQDATRLMSWGQVKEAQAISFNILGKTLSLAAVDPGSTATQKVIKQFQEMGYGVEMYLCSPEGIESTAHYFDALLPTKEVLLKTTVEETGVAHEKEIFAGEEVAFEKGTGPEMLNLVNLQAVRFHASDIHFQPEKDHTAVRMRRDGVMYQVLKISLKQYQLLAGEIKRQSGLKINLTELPQDGDYQFIANDRQISVRVSALPSKYGESLVLRILDAQNATVDLDQLGFSEFNKTAIIEAIEKDRGLILVTGPTGSGKTSTLYSSLHFINTPDKKIITLEDPVEYEIKNIIQSEINDDEGYTFSAGLRAILRQDPDVILVGEIRDRETAEIALQASLTGHLVLSTVHANSAVATIPRLVNMGVKEYILASGLEMIVAQRLVRRLCEHCKVQASVSAAQQKEIDEVVASLSAKGMKIPEVKVFRSEGCDQCAHTAYQGRIAIAEVLHISDPIRKAIAAGESTDVLLEKAKQQGFVTLKEDGILKVLEGKTTFEEVWKVLIE